LRSGAYDRTSDTVQEVTGNAPRSFAQFALEHASFFQSVGQKDVRQPTH
jgi:hypothetical protein